ncbi:MAG: YfiR family protein [Psychrosphaera sp.]|nr:YfiR family protein [Psychrosphaera sp.]
MLKRTLSRLTLVLLTGSLLPVAFLATHKLDRKHPDYVRAVLINKITPYVYWQKSAFAHPDSPINLCIIESERDTIEKIWPYFDLLNNRKAGTHPFSVKDISRFKQQPDKLPDDCHIYYFASLEPKQVRMLVEKATKTSILTIADSLEELHDGVMLAFIEERGKMKIYVNTEAIKNSNLKIKSSLLRIAKKI